MVLFGKELLLHAPDLTGRVENVYNRAQAAKMVISHRAMLIIAARILRYPSIECRVYKCRNKSEKTSLPH
jgi:hypothetical protein